MTILLVSVAIAAGIVTCFAPEQNCAVLALNAIETARREILVSAYALTTGSGIPGALIDVHDRGVAVAVVADRRDPERCQCGPTSLPNTDALRINGSCPRNNVR